MTILTLRTDKPISEIVLYEDDQKLDSQTWEAHRQLAETIHIKIKTLLESKSKTWADIEGVVVFQGPGSFTGLRIGLTVANSLADGLNIPIVGASGKEWAKSGVSLLMSGKNQKLILPNYGSDVHITLPKK